MALYRLNRDTIEPLSIVTFTDLGIKERADLQRLLLRNISAMAPDCLLLTEEFGQWEDSKRRIDLLALDRTDNLVVVELKRDEEGGHMELQALRYAAMASPITFQDAVEAYARTLRKDGKDLDDSSVAGRPERPFLELLSAFPRLCGKNDRRLSVSILKP